VVHDSVVLEDPCHPALATDYPTIKKVPAFHANQSYFNFSNADYIHILDFFLSF